MNTSHHDGGAPDVFSKTASAVNAQREYRDASERLCESWNSRKPSQLSAEQFRMLSSMKQAAEAIAEGAKRLSRPEISQDVADELFDRHKYWHQRFTRSSNRLFKELRDNAAGRRQLEIEGLE